MQRPLYAVIHLHGHVFAPFLDRDDEPAFPFLSLLVSGAIRNSSSGIGNVLRVLGRTHDDAAGEAYDKTARLLGLPFLEDRRLTRWHSAATLEPFSFPRHRPGVGSLDLSFSGLKTSVRYFLESPTGRDAKPEDVAASFQAAVVDVLMARLAGRLRAQSLQRRRALRGRRCKLRPASARSSRGPRGRGLPRLSRRRDSHRQRGDDRRRGRFEARRCSSTPYALSGPEFALLARVLLF